MRFIESVKGFFSSTTALEAATYGQAVSQGYLEHISKPNDQDLLLPDNTSHKPNFLDRTDHMIGVGFSEWSRIIIAGKSDLQTPELQQLSADEPYIVDFTKPE